jgi:hypothetical protein
MRIHKYGALAAAASAISWGIVAAPPASADYGPGADYQVELSANAPGPSGGGVWLWYALNSDGTGDYHGSDCGHGGEGAASDAGDVTWHRVGYQIEIDGTVLAGLGNYPATVTVPATYGHYTGTLGTYISLPPFIPSGIGFSQLQVAP